MTEMTETALPQMCEECARIDGFRRARGPEQGR